MSLLLSLLLATAAQPQDLTYFRGVRVLPMQGEKDVLEDRDVILRGEHILRILPASDTPAPDGSLEIDGAGCTLLPGLVDMHAHLPGTPGQAFELQTYLDLCLLHGVTTLRSVRGDIEHMVLREEIRGGVRSGPDLILYAPPVRVRPGAGSADALAFVQAQRSVGYDGFKYLGGLAGQAFAEFVAGVQAGGTLLCGHAPSDGLALVVETRMHCLEHVSSVVNCFIREGEPRLRTLAGQWATDGGFFCPGAHWYELNTWRTVDPEVLRDAGDFDNVPASVLEAWRAEFQERVPFTASQKARAELEAAVARVALGLVHGSGVTLVATGGDGAFTVPGLGLRRELDFFVSCGLSPMEALRTATANAASCEGQEGAFGQVANGAAANLLLVQGHPERDLADLGRVVGVAVRGVYRTREELAAQLELGK